MQVVEGSLVINKGELQYYDFTGMFLWLSFDFRNTWYPVAGYRYPGTSFPRVSHILPGTGTVPGGPAIWNGVPVTGTRYPDTYL